MRDQRPPPYQQLQPGVRCVLANNPSPMTHWGTNTFLVGTGHVAVIDPGPEDDAHLQAIMAALTQSETISHIFVTHSHLDHSPLARPLAALTGASIFAYGRSDAGRSDIMQTLANSGLAGGGEGVDHSFAPDIMLGDGQTIGADTWQITAHWTPGHFGNHMCFAFGDLLFTGDLVMGWASSLISPPDGDLTQFMASLERIAALTSTTLLPAHGPEITNPAQRIDWLINHRLSRRSDILKQLSRNPADAYSLTQQIYHDTPNSLLPAAERNVFAHLVDLALSSQIICEGPVAANAIFKRI